MPTRVRRAYICDHASHQGIPERQFVGPDDPVPHCPNGHGKMARQANMPYERPDPDHRPTTIGRRVHPKRPAKPTAVKPTAVKRAKSQR